MGKYAVLAIMLAITLSMVIPVYAEVSSVTTVKQFYKKGDLITVNGKTVEALPNQVNIVFVDPNGVKEISGTSTNSTGYFTKIIDTTKSPWKSFFNTHGIFNVTAFLNDEKFEEAKLVRFDFSLDGSPVVPSAFSTPAQQTPPPPKQTTTPAQQQSSQSIQTQNDYKKEFLKYVDSKTDPQYYIERYNNEELYKNWFDTNFPGLDIYNALGFSKTSTPKSEPTKTEPEPAKTEPEPPKQEPQPTTTDTNSKLASFVDPKKDPQSYIDRYNNEPSYKTWFDKSFPEMTIYQAVGVDPPKIGICGPGTEFKDGTCIAKTDAKKTSGGCLIATATYGTELAPQVQQLRELRDNSLLTTNSGSAFMEGFNEFYYSFSPAIADMERQSPIFREAVKLAITPMVTTLSILNYVDMDSEASVLGYGIAIISLNIGMYFVAPAIIVYRIRR